MSCTPDPTILNPDTYLNHLPPDQAKQFEDLRNVYIAVLGAVACDILSYIPEDVRIIRRCSGLITTTCFALVRIFALAYLAMWVAQLTNPVPNCHGAAIAEGILCTLTMGITSFLFLRRVQAVYTGNRWVYWVFAILWLGTSSLVIVLVPGAELGSLPGTGYCDLYRAESYVPIINFMPAVFDTLVFFAISYRIAFRHNRMLGPKLCWASSWFSARTLPVLSKTILQGGQQYYLITFGLNIFVGAFSFNPLIPPTHRVLLTVPAVAFSACLACRAHRIMVEAYYFNGDEETPSVLSALEFNDSGPDSVVISRNVVQVENGPVEPKRLGIAIERV